MRTSGVNLPREKTSSSSRGYFRTQMGTLIKKNHLSECCAKWEVKVAAIEKASTHAAGELPAVVGLPHSENFVQKTSGH